MELRADDSIRKASLLRGDQRIAAITTDDLIAKEVKYHKTCYRDYTRVNYKVAKDYQTNIDEPFEAVKDILFDLQPIQVERLTEVFFTLVVGVAM